MTRFSPSATAGGATVLLLALALSACAAPSSPHQNPAAPNQSPPSQTLATHTGFVGYRWTVSAISDGSADVPIPAHDAVYLVFFTDGMFVANEPVNTHSGPYRVTADGFTTADVPTTLVGGGPTDPASRLAIRAIDALTEHRGTRAVADVTGNRMTVAENGFTLVCSRAARVANPVMVSSASRA